MASRKITKNLLILIVADTTIKLRSRIRKNITPIKILKD